MKYVINRLMWKDIVYIQGNYHYIITHVGFANNTLNDINFSSDRDNIIKKLEELNIGDNVFNLEELYTYLEKMFVCERDDIKTCAIDKIEIPERYKDKFEITDLGGYINGIKI